MRKVCGMGCKTFVSGRGLQFPTSLTHYLYQTNHIALPARLVFWDYVVADGGGGGGVVGIGFV